MNRCARGVPQKRPDRGYKPAARCGFTFPLRAVHRQEYGAGTSGEGMPQDRHSRPQGWRPRIRRDETPSTSRWSAQPRRFGCAVTPPRAPATTTPKVNRSPTRFLSTLGLHNPFDTPIRDQLQRALAAGCAADPRFAAAAILDGTAGSELAGGSGGYKARAKANSDDKPTSAPRLRDGSSSRPLRPDELNVGNVSPLRATASRARGRSSASTRAAS